MFNNNDTESVARGLTDRQIEKMLGTRMSNMSVYSFYDLANRCAGYNTDQYNGYLTYQPEYNIYANNRMKEQLEKYEWYAPRILVLTAIKTVTRQNYPGRAKFTGHARFNADGSCVIANMISYNPETKLFESMARGWIGVHNYHSPLAAAQDGPYRFPTMFTDDAFLAPVIRDTFSR